FWARARGGAETARRPCDCLLLRIDRHGILQPIPADHRKRSNAPARGRRPGAALRAEVASARAARRDRHPAEGGLKPPEAFDGPREGRLRLEVWRRTLTLSACPPFFSWMTRGPFATSDKRSVTAFPTKSSPLPMGARRSQRRAGRART